MTGLMEKDIYNKVSIYFFLECENSFLERRTFRLKITVDEAHEMKIL